MFRSFFQIFNKTKTIYFNPRAIAIIPIDKQKYENVLKNIKYQKSTSIFAWGFYPGIHYALDIPFLKYYAPVCSSFHFMVAHNLIEQIGYDYYKNEYQGKRFWINWNNELVIENPSWKNLYYPRYNIANKIYNNQKCINYIEQNIETQCFTKSILKERQFRFRTAMITFIFTYTNYAHSWINAYMHGFIYYNFPVSITLFTPGVLYLIKPEKTKISRPIIKNNSFKYYYVDTYGNIIFNNTKLGFRKRFPTISETY